jgi:hypothetical protein
MRGARSAVRRGRLFACAPLAVPPRHIAVSDLIGARPARIIRFACNVPISAYEFEREADMYA